MKYILYVILRPVSAIVFFQTLLFILDAKTGRGLIICLWLAFLIVTTLYLVNWENVKKRAQTYIYRRHVIRQHRRELKQDGRKEVSDNATAFRDSIAELKKGLPSNKEK